MPVYVDKRRIRFRHMAMCHMLADTLMELQAMADHIGADRDWLQVSNGGIPHYDVPWGDWRVPPRRQHAIDAGAIEIGMRETSALTRRIRSDPDAFYGGAPPLWLSSGQAILR
jgi:hypothetical protein